MRQPWERNLLCEHAWGTSNNPSSGILSYICDHYGLPWYNLRTAGNFDNACQLTLKNLHEMRTDENDWCFTYMFIDESQDFPSSFIELCREVTERRIYVAGDIFQNIFTVHESSIPENAAQIILNQCYRTDPRTFMFAHAMGMGLLEDKKINWLTDEDWLKCGYHIERLDDGKTYRFRRDPIRRFEDLGFDYQPMMIYKTHNHMVGIVKEIEEWKKDFPSLAPDDIAIIFLDSGQKPFEQAPKIADYIRRRYDWKCNLAYDTKKKIPNTVFISNRNNVKGLEFPLVFCLTSGIQDDLVYRHTMYTMLSRSHVRSVLIFDDSDSSLRDSVRSGIDEIMKHGYMTVKMPNQSELDDIRLTIHSKKRQLSLEERLKRIFSERDIPSSD